MSFLKSVRKKAEAVFSEIQIATQNQQQSQHLQQYTAPPPPSYPPPPNHGLYQPPPPGQPQNFYPPPPLAQHQSFYPPPPIRDSEHTIPPPPFQPQYAPSNIPPASNTYLSPSPSPSAQQTPSHQQSTFSPPPPQVQQYSSPPPPPPPPRNPPRSLPCLAPDGALSKSTLFYNLTTTPDISICENCYTTKIAPQSHLVANFTTYTGPDAQFICDMSNPRVSNTFSTMCIPRNTIEPLLDIVACFGALQPCPGGPITSEGPMYVAKNQSIEGMTICPTCYEIFLRDTAFDQHFERNVYEEMVEWTCDLHSPFYKRLLLFIINSTPAGFSTFAEEAGMRIAVGSCPGPREAIVAIPGTDRYLGYSAVGDKTGLFCPACYYDHLVCTPLADRFGLAEIEVENRGKMTCDLANQYSKVAMTVAVKQGDDEIWRNAVSLYEKLSACPGARGVDEEMLAQEIAEKGDIADWYQMTGYPNIECCPRCYFLTIDLFGATHLFSVVSRPLKAGVVRQCLWTDSALPMDTSCADPYNFENTTCWRGRVLRKFLLAAYGNGDYTELGNFAATLNTLAPPCGGRLRGFKRGSGRKFYGRIAQNTADPDDTTIVICAECHEELVVGTPLEAAFSQDLTEGAYGNERETGFFCQPYSNRAKGYLKDAATKGDLGAFARYWNNRENLRRKKEEWEPMLAKLKAERDAYDQNYKFQMQLKANAMAMALSNQGNAMVCNALTGPTGNHWGNSSIGMGYGSAELAHAAIGVQDAFNMYVPIGEGAYVSLEIDRITALYNKDNEPFLLVE